MIDQNSFNLDKKNEKKSLIKNLVFSMIIKSLIVVVLFLGSLIYIKQSNDNLDVKVYISPL